MHGGDKRIAQKKTKLNFAKKKLQQKNSTISLCDCNFDTDVLVAFTAAILFWMNSVPIKSEEIAAINID